MTYVHTERAGRESWEDYVQRIEEERAEALARVSELKDELEGEEESNRRLTDIIVSHGICAKSGASHLPPATRLHRPDPEDTPLCPACGMTLTEILDHMRRDR